MKVKDLIEQLKKFPEDLEVVGTYPYWDTTCGKDRWELTNDIDFYTNEVLKTDYGGYSYHEIYVGENLVPSSKQTVLILEL